MYLIDNSSHPIKKVEYLHCLTISQKNFFLMSRGLPNYKHFVKQPRKIQQHSHQSEGSKLFELPQFQSVSRQVHRFQIRGLQCREIVQSGKLVVRKIDRNNLKIPIVYIVICLWAVFLQRRFTNRQFLTLTIKIGSFSTQPSKNWT